MVEMMRKKDLNAAILVYLTKELKNKLKVQYVKKVY